MGKISKQSATNFPQGTEKTDGWLQFQNVSISSDLEGKYNLLHVIISKNVRHLIETAGPNFYQYMNSSIFTTKYKVSKCEGEERL